MSKTKSAHQDQNIAERGILLELLWILAGDVTKVTDNHDQNQTGADAKDFL